MKFRIAVCILALALGGCESPYKKSEKKAKDETRDQSNDTTFQSFVGRLRIAVARKDLPMLSSMMTQDFGYRWDNGPEGENVFTYWDQNNLWKELTAVLRERFVPHESYMVAPPQVVADPEYRGYRAGMRQIGGSWKFAYFVSGEGIQ